MADCNEFLMAILFEDGAYAGGRCKKEKVVLCEYGYAAIERFAGHARIMWPTPSDISYGEKFWKGEKTKVKMRVLPSNPHDWDRFLELEAVVTNCQFDWDQSETVRRIDFEVVSDGAPINRMPWKKERPTEPGYYWLQESDHHECELVRIISITSACGKHNTLFVHLLETKDFHNNVLLNDPRFDQSLWQGPLSPDSYMLGRYHGEEAKEEKV